MEDNRETRGRQADAQEERKRLSNAPKGYW